MSEKKNTSLAIGAFVLGALGLIFVALLFFSGGRLFSHKERVIMFFDGSVQGLQIGAPVKLKGVILGEITDIQINFQRDEHTVITAVTADLVMQRINREGGTVTAEFLTTAVKSGLRAQLNFQSFLTGLLYVELDFYPDSPIKLYQTQNKYRELPTIATQFEEISKTLQELDLKEIAKNINHLVLEATKIVDTGEIQQVVSNFNKTLTSIELTSNNLNTQVTQLTQDLGGTRKQMDIFIKQLNTQAPLVAGAINGNLQKLQQTLQQFDQAAGSINNTFAEDAPLINQMTQTLDEVSRSAQALRVLSEALEQQPEALLRGKKSNSERD